MTSLFFRTGVASALLLASVLLASVLLASSAVSEANWVTTTRCDHRGTFSARRVRHYPTDSHATWLWMNYCGLTEVDTNDFQGLPKLEALTLESNDIVHINLAALQLVPTVTKLWLGLNEITQLPVFDALSCSNLILLDVDYNNLTAIADPNTFSACAKLKDLSLDNNQIAHLHVDVFSHLTELTVLSLSNNKITVIAEQMFAKNLKLADLFLDGNKLSYLPPNFASNFKNVGTGLEMFYFNNNPWQCACLQELLADVKATGVAHYQSDTQNGTRAECVPGDASTCLRTPSG